MTSATGSTPELERMANVPPPLPLQGFRSRVQEPILRYGIDPSLAARILTQSIRRRYRTSVGDCTLLCCRYTDSDVNPMHIHSTYNSLSDMRFEKGPPQKKTSKA